MRKTIIQKHGLLLFLILTFAFSWSFWIAANLGWTATGGILPLGPLIAALIVVLLAGGFRGLGAFLARAFRLRIGPWIWLAALLLPVLVDAAAAGLTVAAGAPAPTAAQLAAWPEALSKAVFILPVIALGEEPGWRGFLQQKLQGAGAPLIAVVGVWAAWALWHWPLYGVEMDAATFPAFLVALTGATVVSAFLTNRARGGVLPVMLFHTAVNVLGGGYVFRMFQGDDLVRLWWAFAAMWVAIGLLILIGTRGRLGYDPADRYDPLSPRPTVSSAG